eukprot:gene20409-24349_t
MKTLSMAFNLIFALASLAVVLASSSDLDYNTYGKDYSCYHKEAWAENKNNHYNSRFSSYTGVVTSKYTTPSSSSMNVNKHFKVAGGALDVWTRMLQTTTFFTSFLGRFTLSAQELEQDKQGLRGVHPMAPSPPGSPPPSGAGTPPPG